MRQTREVNLDGQVIVVRELTVAEVRNWLKNLDQVQESGIDLVTEGLLADASLSDICRMTDLPIEALDQMTPSEAETVLSACREINPHFFRLREKLLQVVRTVQPDPASNLNDPLAA